VSTTPAASGESAVFGVRGSGFLADFLPRGIKS
jgi:hypothetical protein